MSRAKIFHINSRTKRLPLLISRIFNQFWRVDTQYTHICKNESGHWTEITWAHFRVTKVRQLSRVGKSNICRIFLSYNYPGLFRMILHFFYESRQNIPIKVQGIRHMSVKLHIAYLENIYWKYVWNKFAYILFIYFDIQFVSLCRCLSPSASSFVSAVWVGCTQSYWWLCHELLWYCMSCSYVNVCHIIRLLLRL